GLPSGPTTAPVTILPGSRTISHCVVSAPSFGLTSTRVFHWRAIILSGYEKNRYSRSAPLIASAPAAVRYRPCADPTALAATTPGPGRPINGNEPPSAEKTAGGRLPWKPGASCTLGLSGRAK